ncbi:MAG: hypothetical protein WDM77_15805 [Steroidobacteraceae bacterium]
MGAGAPSVIIDQGQGLSIERSFERQVSIGWMRVFTKIQESVDVLMHDRAGLGKMQFVARSTAARRGACVEGVG